MRIHKPTLVLVRGLPGSGKTYLTAALAKALRPDDVVVLDPDAIDQNIPEYLTHSRALSQQGIEEKFHLYQYVRNLAHQAINQRKILIWNQPFSSLEGFNKTVTNLTEYATAQDLELSLLVVEVEAPEATAQARVKERKASGGHGPSDDTFARFVQTHESFAKYGYDVVSVQGHGDVSRSVQTILAALTK